MVPFFIYAGFACTAAIFAMVLFKPAKGEKAIEIAGQTVRDILEFAQIDEVTVVSGRAAGAGGMLLNLSETLSKLNESYDKQTEVNEMKNVLKWLRETYPKLVENLKDDDPDLQAGIEKALASIPEATKEKLISEGYELPGKSQETAISESKIRSWVVEEAKKLVSDLDKVKNDNAVKLLESKDFLDKGLKESKTLPDAEKTEIRNDYGSKIMTELEINKMLKTKVDKFAALQETGVYVPDQERAKIHLNADEIDKKVAAFEGMLMGEDVEINGKKIPRFKGIHESFRKITNYNEGPAMIGKKIMESMAIGLPPLDSDPAEWWTGLRASASGSRLQEVSLIADWATVFGDSIRRAMMRLYDRTDLSGWRLIFEVGSAPDFRNNLKQRLGGFGNLETVSSGQTYPVISNITDDEVSYAVAKRGGLYSIRMEDVVNDDLGVIRQIPRKLSQAAAQTLHEFVFDFLDDNTAMDYDGVALGHASLHGANLGTVALSDAALDDRLFNMLQQTEQDSGKPLGLKPKFLCVPAELERIALEITVSHVTSTGGRTETVPNVFFTNYGLVVVPVYYWTDATDWFLVMDPIKFPTGQIDFLNGREEPEIFVQDQPTIGSVFTADAITYKIRHIYGGDLLDHRGFDVNQVSG